MRLYLRRFNELDSALCLRVNRVSHYRWVRLCFRLVSRHGDGVFWYAVMLGIWLTQGLAGLLPCLHMILVGLFGTLLYKWLKGKTSRPRPYEIHRDIWLTGTPLGRLSFPSGHTLHAVAFCSVALVYYPMLAWILLPFTFMVAMSRVILGLHYPSDVLAGALIGLLIASVSFAI
ncbi:MAG: phosphatase PAP2 family protein [Methylophilaceae bacterium]